MAVLFQNVRKDDGAKFDNINVVNTQLVEFEWTLRCSINTVSVSTTLASESGKWVSRLESLKYVSLNLMPENTKQA